MNGLVISLLLALIGAADSLYLTIEHYSSAIPPCTGGQFADCGIVLQSTYATVYGIPLALIGLVHYLVLAALLYAFRSVRDRRLILLILLQIAAGALASVYFAYLQIGVLKALCLYCMVSAVNSWILAVFGIHLYKRYVVQPVQKKTNK